MRATTTDAVARAWIITTTSRGRIFYEAGWRHRDSGGTFRLMKRRIGPAWLDRTDDGYQRRRGRVQPGFFDERGAVIAMDQLVHETEAQLATEEQLRHADENRPATFRDVSCAYVDWLIRVRDAKPATLRDHRYLLAEPGTPHRRGTGSYVGTIMAALGDRPADEVSTREINHLLDRIADTGSSARTVNKHRQLLCAIYNFAGKRSTFALKANPATSADRRQEPERPRLLFYSPQDVERLARALDTGAHRDPGSGIYEQSEIAARLAEDRQDGDLVRVAAFTGLRRGELLALRWSDVELEHQRVVVHRAVSAGEEASSTKSRRAREVPIPSQAAAAFNRLRERTDFTSPDDFVFVNRLGRRIDGSALRRRVERARDAVGLRKLRFHDLRHTYGSLLVAGGIDLASVKSAMGHSRITTTERYLHARPATELAQRFSRAFDES